MRADGNCCLSRGVKIVEDCGGLLRVQRVAEGCPGCEGGQKQELLQFAGGIIKVM